MKKYTDSGTMTTIKQAIDGSLHNCKVEDKSWGTIDCYSDKLKVGLQQLMAGARKFNIGAITRKDVAALTEEAARVSGLSYVMDAYRQEAIDIIDS